MIHSVGISLSFDLVGDYSCEKGTKDGLDSVGGRRTE